MSFVLAKKVLYKAVVFGKCCYCYVIALFSYLMGKGNMSCMRQFRGSVSNLPVSHIDRIPCLSEIETENLLEAANCVLNHKVKIFDYKYIDVSKANNGSGDLFGANSRFYNRNYRPIDWHCDCKSGYRWNKVAMPEMTLRHLPPSSGADIIWPWELSRFQHIPALAIASYITEEIKKKGEYWNEFRDQLTDWIRNNPCGLGVNWATEMDIAMRVVSWVIAFSIFGRKVEIDDPWQQQFWHSVWEHGRVLYKCLIKPQGRKGNHYATQIAGLYIVATLCPFFTESTKWKSIAKARLEEQVQVQVRSDGTHIEDSTSYHLLVTEIFLYTGIIADSLNDPFSEDYRKYIHKMLCVIDGVSSSMYNVPQIGDNDDGYFLKPIFMEENHTRAGHIVNIGEQYIDGTPKWSLHEALINILVVRNQILPRYVPTESSGVRILEDAGWAVLEQGQIKIVMCLGPSGLGNRGGHSHEDILSFTLYWKGLPVIVDPGTYVYTADRTMRNRFRYAVSHNQPQQKVKEEQWINKSVFTGLSTPDVKYEITINLEGRENGIYAQAQYTANEHNYVATRRIGFWDSHYGIAVNDCLRSTAIENSVVSLCLHPDVICRDSVDGKYELIVGGEKLLFQSTNRFVKKRGNYSASYGLVSETDWLVGEDVGNDLLFSWTLKVL